MKTKFDESARALIGAGADATLVTINPDGDELVSAHLTKYKKTRNIRRDPRVAVTILGQATPGRQAPYLSVTGIARVVEDGAPELLTELADVMLGSSAHFPPANAPAGLLTRIRVDKVGGIGPWASDVR